MNKLPALVAWTLLASCAPADPNGDPAASTENAESLASSLGAAHHHHRPFLSSDALWTAEGPARNSGECFAGSVAVGDLDGDGYRDVIVSDSECIFGARFQGRIAIYRGGPDLPSTTAVWTDLDWQNPQIRSRNIRIDVADVDGDHHDDLLVRSLAGVQVFTHITDLGAPLGPPTFRLPGTGTFNAAILADVNGDRRADLIAAKNGAVTVWLSTPGAPGGPFTAARVIPAPVAPVRVDDTNGDGKDDVLLTSVDGSQLFLGCRARERDCDGGLRTAPAWTTTQPVIGMVPDLNHDGRMEAIATDVGFGATVGFGRIWMYLSDRATGLEATPAWATIGDPNYVFFGTKVVVPGDLDGDHRTNEFVMPSDGRIYVFSPELHGLAHLQPSFAWPRHDAAQAQIDADELQLAADPLAIAAAGDVNRDGFDDLVVGETVTVTEDEDDRPRVVLLAGGRLPRHDGPPPLLQGAPVCNLPTGKADITVDTVSLARSLFVERKTFDADACELAEQCIGGTGERRLLRFSTALANVGGAPAIIPGPDTAPELYRLNTCENELELDGFARYELVDATGTVVATGRKQSIFPIDLSSSCINAGPATDYFPDEGVSPGWADVYLAGIPCQWLDATDVPDGRYSLRITVDVNHLIDQDDVAPDTVSVDVELAGDHVTVLH